MNRFFGRCFGGPGKRKTRRQAEDVRERSKSTEGSEEAPVLRYPLFDPRKVKTKEINLSDAPLERHGSTSPDVPRELATREDITLPADLEEEAAQPLTAELDAAEPLPEEIEVAQPLPEETVAAQSLPEETGAAQPLAEESVAAQPLLDETVAAQPLPEEPTAAVAPLEDQQPAQAEAPTALPAEKGNKDSEGFGAPVIEKETTLRAPAAPPSNALHPSGNKLVSSRTKTPQAAASVPETEPIHKGAAFMPQKEPPAKAAAAARPAKVSRLSQPPGAASPKKESSSVRSEASSSIAARRPAVPERDSAVVGALKLPEMSPLEKLNSAREEKPLLSGTDEFGDDEADTAPCTPRESERRQEQQLAELKRKLTRQMQALEELQRISDDEKQVPRLYHDRSRRKRKQRVKSKRRKRVGWSYVQAAIDCYAEVQDGALEDFRMYLDAHPPADCRICRNFDFSDVPLL